MRNVALTHYILCIKYEKYNVNYTLRNLVSINQPILLVKSHLRVGRQREVRSSAS